MPEAYGMEIRERAEELFIVDGQTYEQVAVATGVSVSQLKRWGDEREWTEKRREYRGAIGEIKRNTMLLRKNLVAKALTSLNPQDVYAFARLEAATSRGSGEDTPSLSAPDGPMREIKTAGDAVNALQDALALKLNEMLSQPAALSLAGVRDMKKCLDLLDELHKRYRPEEIAAGKGGVSEELAEQIKQRILFS